MDRGGVGASGQGQIAFSKSRQAKATVNPHFLQGAGNPQALRGQDEGIVK